MAVIIRISQDEILNRDTYYTIIVRYCVYRILHKKNMLICICGGTGSGKSLSALFLAEKIQEQLLPLIPFTAQNICFTGQEFMRLVENLPSGSTIVWDEVGVGLNSRRAMTNINIVLSNVFQTFRHQCFVTILTTPDFGYIDKNIRKLLHVYAKTDKINFGTGTNQLTIHKIENNPRLGMVYFPFFEVQQENIGRFRMNHIYTRLPSNELINQYDIVKKKFTDDLNKKARIKLTEADTYEMLTKMEKDVWLLYEAGINITDISKQVNIEESIVFTLVKNVSKKLKTLPNEESMTNLKNEYALKLEKAKDDKVRNAEIERVEKIVNTFPTEQFSEEERIINLDKDAVRIKKLLKGFKTKDKEITEHPEPKKENEEAKV